MPLQVVEGAVPPDLTGHLFVIAPASTVDPPTVAQRSTLMVGDGIISRFDMSNGAITLTTRLARTHDFVADEVTAGDPALGLFRFGDAGIVRLGLLGSRDFANTALVPMKRGSEATRLMLTYDAGRPVEIDPVTLEVVTPVGARDDWRAEALPDAVFPVVLSPAHPGYDRASGDLFTVNYGRGVINLAETIPIVSLLSNLPRSLELAFDQLATIVGVDRAYRWLVKKLERLTTKLDRGVESFLDRFLPSFIPDTFTDLVRWDGSSAFERWRLVLDDGREVRILQSVHQIAVTRDHVIVLETGFKLGLQSAFNDPLPRTDSVERLLRALLTRPQLPYTAFYVVPRASLTDSAPMGDDGVRRVTCARVEVPLEADHFLADYDDTGGKIRLHVAHSPATDLSEWVRPYDVSAYDGRPVPAELHGVMAVGAMDIGRFGRYDIDAATGTVQRSETLVDDRTSWAIALYAGNGLNTDAPLPERIEHVYWCTEGVFPELLTEFVHELYENYPHRLVPISKILAMGQGGRPSCVVRVDSATLTLGDVYELPDGVLAGSLQFVPRPGASSDTAGYLVGTMYTDARTELWVFDAGALAAGPVCKLAAPDWVIGFSLHTAWLETLAPRTSSYRVTAREDMERAVKALSRETDCPELAEAFEAHVYPRFE